MKAQEDAGKSCYDLGLVGNESASFFYRGCFDWNNWKNVWSALRVKWLQVNAMKRSTHCVVDVTSARDNWRRALTVFWEEDVPDNELNNRIH